MDQRTAASNRLTQALKIYYPQVLRWFDDLTTPLAGAFLTRWPMLPAAQRARPETVRDFFYAHNCRNQKLIDQRIEDIRKAMPATTDAAIVDTSVLLVQNLVKLLAVLRDNIAACDEAIAAAAHSHPDWPIFDSFPGAGEILAPRLIAAFGTRRQRFASAADLQSFVGIAPVTEQSGATEWVHFRWACPKFLRQTFHEWAGHSIAFSQWARAYYDQQKSRGAGHHAAVRSLAAKWIRIAFRCWQDGRPYDERVYLDALRRHGSPLATSLDLVT